MITSPFGPAARTALRSRFEKITWTLPGEAISRIGVSRQLSRVVVGVSSSAHSGSFVKPQPTSEATAAAQTNAQRQPLTGAPSSFDNSRAPLEKFVKEKDVPSFLWRSVPDEDALAKLPSDARMTGGNEASEERVFHIACVRRW